MKPQAGFKYKKPIPSGKEITFEDLEARDLPSPTAARRRRLDPLSDALGCANYYHKMRWHWFTFEFGGLHHPMEVSRFYKEKNLAIDIMIKEDAPISQLKARLLKEHGIKYAILKNPNDFEALIKEGV